MKGVDYISIRKSGQNFGKPLATKKVLLDYKISELKELYDKDALRFYNEEGDAIPSDEAFNVLADFGAYEAFGQCKTKEDFEKFIAGYPNSALVKRARVKIEEILINSAETPEDFERFLMRFPESKFAEIAKSKIPGGFQERILVITSVEQLEINDQIIASLKDLGKTKVSSAVFEKNNLIKLENHATGHDAICLVIDDRYYLEVFLLFAIAMSFKKKVIPIFAHDHPLKKVSVGDFKNRLIQVQGELDDEHAIDVIRNVRFKADTYLGQLSSSKKVKTNQLSSLKALL